MQQLTLAAPVINQSHIASTPRFSQNRQHKSKSSIGHYQYSESFKQVTTVFQQAKEFMKDVDTKISQFKKFNQNKVTMRYEYLIKTMEKQINILKTRLNYEQSSKNPTKQYMKGLLDQLLIFKKQNQRLKEEIEKYKQIIAGNQKEIKDNRLGIKSLELSLKGKVERLPLINYNGNNILDLISKFKEEKQNINDLLNFNSEESRLEKYLKEIEKQKPSWDILKLLIQIDKWVESQDMKDGTPRVDIWKIRYGALERFNKIREDSVTPIPVPVTSRWQKSSSVDNKGRGSIKQQRTSQMLQKDNRYQKPKLRRLKQKVLSNLQSRKFTGS